MMKRMISYALGAVITLSAVPAYSQDNFPDAQENHWAFEALARMKALGLLVGYPDGLFRGGRPASRYEMAVALYALYLHLKGITDSLEAQQTALKEQIERAGTGGGVSREELQALKDSLAQVQSSVAGMRSWGDDIAALKRGMAENEREIASLGVDVEALKKSVADLEARMRGAGQGGPVANVILSGDANMWFLGAYSGSDTQFGITRDGRPTGVARDGSMEPVGATRDLTSGAELAITMSGRGEENWNWHATLVGTNLLEDAFGTVFGNQSSVFPQVPFMDAPWDFYAQSFGITIDTSLAGQGFKGDFGRVGEKISPYIFQRPKEGSLYFENDRWDNGMWYFDGAKLAMVFGGNSNFTIFGGRQSLRTSVNGIDINPMFAGQSVHPWVPGADRPRGIATGELPIDQHLGATLGIRLGEDSKLNLAYLILDSNSSVPIGAAIYNRVIVMGADANFMFGGIGVNAFYSQSNLNEDSENRVDQDNKAYGVGVAFKTGNVDIGVGWEHFDPLFSAPGDWGRIGFWTNPTDLEGINAHVNIGLGDNTSLMLGGRFMRGADVTIGGITGFTNDDKVNSLKAKLTYKVNESWDLTVGGEFVNWDLDTVGGFPGGKPTERWFSLGFRYKMGQNAFWSFLWENSNYNDDGLGPFGWNAFNAPFGAFGAAQPDAKGGVIVSQIGIKY